MQIKQRSNELMILDIVVLNYPLIFKINFKYLIK